jgi:two-component system, sensor histidine kinase RegB
VLFVHKQLGFDLAIYEALAAIIFAGLLNLFLRLAYPLTQRLSDIAAFAWLSFDILQLALLLWLTGGIENPFVILIVAPVLISAAALPPLKTLLLGLLAAICLTALLLWHQPLPWDGTTDIRLPWLYQTGLWIAMLIAIAFIGIYAWRVAEEGRQYSAALTATELALSREKSISDLDGLAAAAAHKLGTPLATISLITNELRRRDDLPADVIEDIALLRSEAVRCRDILAEIASLGDDQDSPLGAQPLDVVLHDLAEPYWLEGKSVSINLAGDGTQPVIARNPAVLYGLGNLIENAIDFAKSQCQISADWNTDRLRILVSDDGGGFAPEILSRLGDPFLSTRRTQPRSLQHEQRGGLGLGLFIAKTLLERSGATVDARNRPGSGAEIAISWPRKTIEVA